MMKGSQIVNIQIKYNEDKKTMTISTDDGKMPKIDYQNTCSTNSVHGFASTTADALLHYMKAGLSSNAWKN